MKEEHAKYRLKWFHTLQFRIWRTVTGVLLVFLVSMVLLNQGGLARSREEFLYRQLHEAAEAKNAVDRQKPRPETPDTTGTTYINHFLMRMQDDTVVIQADRFTQFTYMDGDNHSPVLEGIASKLEKQLSEGTTPADGRLEANGSLHYFHPVLNEDGSLMVYLASVKEQEGLSVSHLWALLAAILAGLLASGIVARGIARPIRGLERFAGEVARHRWDAEAPRSDIVEIQRLSDALVRMKEVLKDTEERERQFLQAGSHSLKTPVMAIKGYAQAWIDGVRVHDDRSAASVIRCEAEVLEHRIRQLLRMQVFGNNEEMRVQEDVVRVDRLLNAMVARFRPMRPELVWELSLPQLEMTCRADAMQTLVENLLENGIRYAETRMVIRAEVDGNLRLTFENDGPAIALAQPDVLFDAYRKDRDGQFGLGLAIVREIAEGHGGTAHVENLAPEGVRFVVTLPASVIVLPEDPDPDPSFNEAPVPEGPQTQTPAAHSN